MKTKQSKKESSSDAVVAPSDLFTAPCGAPADFSDTPAPSSSAPAAPQAPFKRTQTYKNEAILKKIDTVINNTLESYKKDYTKKFNKIVIGARCMAIGISVTAYSPRGSSVSKIKGNLDSYDLMNEVKYDMYNQAKNEGAWFFCRIEILPTLSYTITFNYDDREKLPEERTRSNDSFLEEFRLYPRGKDFTPDWWQKILKNKAKYL